MIKVVFFRELGGRILEEVDFDALQILLEDVDIFFAEKPQKKQIENFWDDVNVLSPTKNNLADLGSKSSLIVGGPASFEKLIETFSRHIVVIKKTRSNSVSDDISYAGDAKMVRCVRNSADYKIVEFESF